MYLNKVIINNFKNFKYFVFYPNKSVNILVGNNNVGKSTILEAIHLAITGMFRGRYVKNFLTQDIFNREIVEKYIHEIKENKSAELPELDIELFFEDSVPILLGLENSDGIEKATIKFSIKFDSRYQDEYELLKKEEDIVTLPIEYYMIEWKTSADKDITSRTIPIKSILIDTSDSNLKTSSDTCISKIVKEKLEEKEIIDVSQAYRRVRDIFIQHDTIKKINEKLSVENHLMNNNIQLDVEMLNKNDWERAIITKVNDVPFDYVGKGEQSTLKIELSLTNKRAEKSEILLLEEPENHLTYPKLNRLISDIIKFGDKKQIFITTHNSFVANKLGIDNLELLENSTVFKFSDLDQETKEFFLKKPGYDTLRLLLCKKAILVEGDADELVVQKAYIQEYNNLPIEDEIDIISVGTSFLRFLKIANILKKETVVVTDNDGNIKNVEKKYDEYLKDNKKEYIKICFDENTHNRQGSLKASNGGEFNYDTLEPCMLRANSLDCLNKILNKKFSSDDEIIDYMVKHKTDTALKLFEYNSNIKFPEYIKEAIKK